MDKHQVIADRESGKIDGFLTAMVAQGKMTVAEKQVVQQEWEGVARAAGWVDARGSLTGRVEDEADAAVTRHINHLQKTKIIELHPELKVELERFIESRPYHPLPSVPAGLARPGVALTQYHALVDYIAAKRAEGVIGHEEAHAIYEPAITVFEDSGVYLANLDDKTDKAVLVQAYSLMKQKLLEIRPESLG